MLTAISRYGARVLPNTEQIIAECRRRGQMVQGPHIPEFEAEFARSLGGGRAVSTSHGHMAFFYVLKAFRFPAGSEIIFPALTFWVMPEIARVAGLKPVFADVDPSTFTIDPNSLAQTITPRTRAVVPTHLYGLPCDIDAVLTVAGRHNLAVIEDCAHALGARYRGRPVGTFGDAAIFSFQMLKPLNTYGGGMALVRDSVLAARVAELAYAEPWPTEAQVRRRLRIGRLQRIFIRPRVFMLTGFPILWLSSWFGARPDVYLWERIRRLDPLPAGYAQRYSNVQAALGLAGLSRLEDWTLQTRAHARIMDEALREVESTVVPRVPPERFHVYYQYCIYPRDRDQFVRRRIRRGIDVEMLHVDVCPSLPLFGDCRLAAPGAERAAEAVQLPVYVGLSDRQMQWIARQVRRALRLENALKFGAPAAARMKLKAPDNSPADIRPGR